MITFVPLYSSQQQLLVFPVITIVLLFLLLTVNTCHGTATATATATASNSTTTTCVQQQNNSDTQQRTVVDVVIVGAGIAGLAAFVELQRLDPTLTVVIVEATDRIAGRIKKTSIGGITVELGANWLHNIDSPLYKLAQKMKIKTVQTTFLDIAVYDVNGEPITRRFESRFNRFISEGKPFYNMLLAANDTWEDPMNSEYDGSESVLTVLRDYNYKEQSELDAYIRWWMFDYEYGFSNVSLLNYNSIDYNIPSFIDSETLVGDSRGYESIIHQYVQDHSIQPIYLNTKVTDIIYDNEFSNELNETYKTLIETVNTTTNCTSTTYLAKRVIVTVPVAVLRGAGYAINFRPTIDTTNLPMVGNQFNKVFFQFKANFWGTSAEFIAILRPMKQRYVCNHWQNLDIHIPGSKILFCLLTKSGMKKFIQQQLTPYDLLEPLRIVFGTTVVDTNYKNVVMSRWDLDPSTGYAGYSSFHAGYTLHQWYKFWGGHDYYTYDDDTFIQGEGYSTNSIQNNTSATSTKNKESGWIVHLSGAGSCFEYNEQVDGGYYSGIRSARYVVRSLGKTNVEPFYECEP